MKRKINSLSAALRCSLSQRAVLLTSQSSRSSKISGRSRVRLNILAGCFDLNCHVNTSPRSLSLCCNRCIQRRCSSLWRLINKRRRLYTAMSCSATTLATRSCRIVAIYWPHSSTVDCIQLHARHKHVTTSEIVQHLSSSCTITRTF